METFKLSRPIVDGDDKITEIEFDLDSVGFTQIPEIEKRFAREYGGEDAQQIMLKHTNTIYQIIYLSYASNIPYEVLRNMSARDAISVGMRVQNFLFAGALGLDLETLENPSSSEPQSAQ